MATKDVAADPLRVFRKKKSSIQHMIIIGGDREKDTIGTVLLGQR